MNAPILFAQLVLLLLLAPLLSGLIKNWKAKLQNRRGPRPWQPYFDLLKFHDLVLDQGPLPVPVVEKLVMPTARR